MGQVIQVNGDYNIKTKPTGTITLDTGVATGKVVVTGNLEVKGHVLSVASDDLTIKDNIIVLNNGETGAGVTLANSGLLIDRGTLVPAALLYNESSDSWNFVHGYDDNSQLYSFANSNIKVKSILTDSLTDNGDLTLIATGSGVVKVDGTTDYENRILDYSKLNVLTIDTISRTGYIATVKTTDTHYITAGDSVDVYCSAATTFNGNSITVLSATTDTFTYESNHPAVTTLSVLGYVRKNPVISDDNIPSMKAVADFTKSVVSTSIDFLNVSFNSISDYNTSVTVTDYSSTLEPSQILFEVDGGERTRATIDADGLTVKTFYSDNPSVIDTINISNTSISSSTHSIKVDSVLSLKTVATDPVLTSGFVSLYSKDASGQGGTGLYFVNTAGTKDELVSRSKAFLYSLIF
jgi:hypothetical protein